MSDARGLLRLTLLLGCLSTPLFAAGEPALRVERTAGSGGVVMHWGSDALLDPLGLGQSGVIRLSPALSRQVEERLRATEELGGPLAEEGLSVARVQALRHQFEGEPADAALRESAPETWLGLRLLHSRFLALVAFRLADAELMDEVIGRLRADRSLRAKSDPASMGEALHLSAFAHRVRGEATSPASLREADQEVAAALRITSPDRQRALWAGLRHLQGRIGLELARMEGRMALLDEAVAAFEEGLGVADAGLPAQRALILGDLGQALLEKGWQLQDGAVLQRGQAVMEEALALHGALPLARARDQQRLGQLLVVRSELEGDPSLAEQGVTRLYQVLEVVDREQHALWWSQVTQWLARGLIARSPTDMARLQEAFELAQKAEVVPQLEAWPLRQADCRLVQGLARLRQAQVEKSAERYREAREIFQAADGFYAMRLAEWSRERLQRLATKD
ncbi:MAG: hypothetical protein HQL56_11545 [Magnetococcales bacterium]|nr:hypothetical protein [Magnetococcales bacterium]